MKIIHCVYSFLIGGAEVLAIDLSNEMCKLHDCSLIIVNNKWSQELIDQLDKRVKIYFIERVESSRNPFPIIKFNKLLLKLKPDVIHCHDQKLANIIFTGAKKIYTVHAMNVPIISFHMYNSITTISDAVTKDVLSRYRGKNVVTVYNGIYADKFLKRKQYIEQNETIRLVQVSRLAHEIKGQDILLHAIAHLKVIGLRNFHVDFVGGGASRTFLEDLTISLGLQDEVTFLGSKDRNWLYETLCNYHLLVQPSRNEGFALTILEGFAAGLPVLASNIDGPAELVNQTERGWLFESENVNACASRLIEIIEKYQSGEMQQLMERTVSLAESKYSLKACSDKFLEVYNDVFKDSN